MNSKLQAQIDYCKSRNEICWVGSGVCWCCGKDIFDKITLEDASTELITSCPFCNSSFVD